MISIIFFFHACVCELLTVDGKMCEIYNYRKCMHGEAELEWSRLEIDILLLALIPRPRRRSESQDTDIEVLLGMDAP
jgi:hypothetical protein